MPVGADKPAEFVKDGFSSTLLTGEMRFHLISPRLPVLVESAGICLAWCAQSLPFLLAIQPAIKPVLKISLLLSPVNDTITGRDSLYFRQASSHSPDLSFTSPPFLGEPTASVRATERKRKLWTEPLSNLYILYF